MSIIFMSGYSEHVFAGPAHAGRGYLSGQTVFLPKRWQPKCERRCWTTRRSPGTIMIADDEPGVRAFLRQILAAEG